MARSSAAAAEVPEVPEVPEAPPAPPPTTGSDVLRRGLHSQRRRVLASSLLFCGHQAGEALVPVVIGVVVDRAVRAGGDGPTMLLWWIAVLAALFLALSYCYRFGAREGERANLEAAHDLRLELAARVLDERGGADAGRLPGVLASIGSGDARRVGEANRAVPYGVSALAGLVVTAVVLLSMSVPLGLLVLLGAPVLLVAARLLGKPLEARSVTERESAADASGVAVDLVDGVRVLKGLGADRVAARRYRATSRLALRATVGAARANAGHDGGMLVCNGLFIAAIALVGGRLALAGAISIGDLVAAVGLAQFLIGPLTMFSLVNGDLAQSRASARRVADVLASPPAVLPGHRAPETVDVAGAVGLRGVRSGPLRGLDLEVPAGRFVGVVADPAGAAALLALLARDTDPEDGVVELDGVGLGEIGLDRLRHAVVVAAHDAALFDGSVTDNIGPASPRVLAAAGVDEVATVLPSGLDSSVAERGRALSGGQRQRVALARALALDPPVLVLHDPTTAVDAVTESRIAAGLRELRAGRTTVVVTTSPGLLAVADEVVVLDAAAGTVSARGRHEELAADADYRKAVLA